MGEKLVLIDGHSILNRAFYGMPDLTNSAGLHTGAVYGFLNILFRILDEEKADYLAVAFDVHAPTFRHEAYPEYKGTRHAMPDELREQVPLIKKVLQAMKIYTVEQAGLEADDILGTLARKAEADGMDVSLVSGDRDLLQIATDKIRIRIPKTKKGQTTVENYYAADVLETMQVTPREFIDVKALQGDSSDNVPGVPKVGPKTATDLIVQYHSVQGVYDHLDEITKKGLHDTLEANRELAELSLFLVTIKTDSDVTLDKDKAKLGDIFTEEAYALYTELGFKNLLRHFSVQKTDAVIASAATTFQYEVVRELSRAQALMRRAERAQEVAVYPVFDKDQFLPEGRLCGLAAAFDEKAYYIPVAEEKKSAAAQDLPLGQLAFDFGGGSAAVTGGLNETDNNNEPDALMQAAMSGDEDIVTQKDVVLLLKGLREWARGFGRDDIRIAVFGIKEQYGFFGVTEEEMQDGIHLEGIFDLLIGAYLVNPLKNDYAPEDIASEYLSETIMGRKQFLDKLTFRDKAAEEGGEDAVAAYACHIAWTLLRAAGPVKDKLSASGMWQLYTDIERPLSYILFNMEQKGIRALPDKLKEYGDQLTGRIDELEKSIHEAAGSDFNISSPKQLGEILFEQMQIPGGKKTKTGYSTAADVLEKLAPDYPFVADILEYRGLTKLKSTYADGLGEYIAPDHRIHTTLHQTITATGRISSTEPNLQNIPMRTELGRAIRKVFVPAEGYSFTDADYSQIELRILAHMSGDESLIEAYKGGRDIHRMTASKVFGVPFEQVTDLQRRNAKAVNFGIVYGISSFGLSQNISISRKEAAEYIKQYFQMFPGIKSFLDEQVEFAKANGYSVTLYGRRRPIPELKNSNFMQRQFGERVAMNAPIQGTGADIMKIAMIRVWEELHRQRLKSRLILQIHDELLIETAPGEEDAVQKILTEGMMGAAQLKVSLEVDVHSGSDWYEAK